jgi:hypothetical protein
MWVRIKNYFEGMRDLFSSYFMNLYELFIREQKIKKKNTGFSFLAGRDYTHLFKEREVHRITHSTAVKYFR